jgi:hypothetical protein
VALVAVATESSNLRQRKGGPVQICLRLVKSSSSGLCFGCQASNIPELRDEVAGAPTQIQCQFIYTSVSGSVTGFVPCPAKFVRPRTSGRDYAAKDLIQNLKARGPRRQPGQGRFQIATGSPPDFTQGCYVFRPAPSWPKTAAIAQGLSETSMQRMFRSCSTMTGEAAGPTNRL